MKKLSLISVFALAIVGCKMGKNYKGTEFIVSDGYAQADTSITVQTDTVNTDTLEIPSYSNLLWWEVFDDPTLDSLIVEAFANNKDALITAENIIQARYALKIQNKEFLPKFDINASAQRGNFIQNQIGTDANLFMGGATLYWELDFWGKFRRMSESAKAEYMASEYGYRSLMISLVSEVASTYFSLLQAKSQLEISQRNAFSRDSMLIIIEARYDKGIIPYLDVNQAQIQKAIAAGSVPQYQRNIVQLENALSILLGRNPGPIEGSKTLKDQEYEIEIPLATPVDLLARRPDVVAAEFNLIGQNAEVGVAQANRLPAISVTALLGLATNDINEISIDDPLWNIGGQLAGPLFYWGQRKRAVDIEKSRRYQALFAYENTVINAMREVEDVLVEISTYKEEIEIGKYRAKAALEAQNLSRERYSKGVTSYLEFLEQQRQAFDAELHLEALRANLLSSYVQLYKALGGGWLSETEKKEAANTNNN